MKGKGLNLIMEEKPLDLEYTPVFSQPKLTRLKRTKLPTEPLVKWAAICYYKEDKEEFGRIYNQLLLEYKPLIEWAFLSWDYLLTTQGVRYLPRKLAEKYYTHGDYRAFTQRDYRKLIHKCFKELLLYYHPNGSFDPYLRKNFWPKIIQNYELLKIPKDKKERLLTEYSYLRCIPYTFLNSYHERRVKNTLKILDQIEFHIVEMYFLKFYKEEICAQENNLKLEDFLTLREKALEKIKFYDYLSYALLKQIERY